MSFLGIMGIILAIVAVILLSQKKENKPIPDYGNGGYYPKPQPEPEKSYFTLAGVEIGSGFLGIRVKFIDKGDNVDPQYYTHAFQLCVNDRPDFSPTSNKTILERGITIDGEGAGKVEITLPKGSFVQLHHLQTNDRWYSHAWKQENEYPLVQKDPDGNVDAWIITV